MVVITRRDCFLLFFLSGCCCQSTNICPEAQMHADRLRRHFRGDRVGDISTLISETRMISARLKEMNMWEEAKKFDSYIDVLTYGNNTIYESIRDVKELTQHNDGVCSPIQCLKYGICNLKTKLFNIF